MTNTQSTKHTPGPWTSKPFGVPQWEDDPLGVYVIPEVKRKLELADDAATEFINDETKYALCMDAIHAEQQANAKLIAQAPAMAEALAALLATAKVANIAGQSLYKADVVVEAEQVLRDAGVLV